MKALDVFIGSRRFLWVIAVVAGVAAYLSAQEESRWLNETPSHRAR
jgi:hypothetical protein